MIRIRPDRRFHPLEQLIARKLNHLYNFSWIEATLGLGQKFHLPGLLPRSPIVVEAIGQKHTDFIGINYYTKAYVQWRPRAKESNIIDESPVGLSFARRKEVSSDLGWAIYPRGLGSFLKELKKYNTPIFITENGIADKEDVHRPQYLLEHLREVAIARKAGIDVRGYFHWSLLDNFEWVKGFSPRFGLYSVDYSTFERTMTKSARKYQEIIRSHDTGPPSQTRLDGLLRALSGNDDECLPPTKS
jgi:beta-glucosidase